MIPIRYRLKLKESDQSQSKILSQMEHLSTIMRPIRYGYLHKSGKKILADVNGDFDDEEWFDGYILMTPKQVLENKLGVCWDDVELERYYCEKHNIPHSTYFYINGKHGSTHTILVFKTEDNKFYWFEHSWYNQRGIHGPFTSIKDIFKTNIKLQKTNNLVRFYKYGKPQYGCNALQFQKFAMKHLVYKEGGD